MPGLAIWRWNAMTLDQGARVMYAIPLPFQLYMPLLVWTLCLTLAAVLAFDHSLHRSIQRLIIGFQLRRLRMGRMLAARGISPAQYLRAASAVELRKQLARCRDCRQKTRCDQAFAMGPSSDPHYSFCPNTFALNRVQATAAGAN